MKKIIALSILIALISTLGCSCSRESTENETSNEDISSEQNEKIILSINDVNFEDVKYNTDNTNSNCIYDIKYANEKAVAPKEDFCDIVVTNNLITAIYPKNTAAFIPNTQGYLFRLIGEDVEKSKGFSIGERVSTHKFFPETISPYRVKVDGKTIPVNGFNVKATSERQVTIFNSDYYDRCTDVLNGIELAVKDGKISFINRESGKTEIPQDGYVLSVISNSYYTLRLTKLKEGEEIVFENDTPLYMSNTLYSVTKNISEITGETVVYTSEFGEYTEKNDNNRVEIVVNNGIIKKVNKNENDPIPKDGFIISIHTSQYDLIKECAVIGTTVYYNEKSCTLFFVSTPEIRLSALKEQVPFLKTQYDNAKDKLYNIEYEELDSLFNSLETLIASDEYTAKEYKEGIKTVKKISYLLYPSLTLQDRAAWITVAELKADGTFLIHIDCEEDVIKYVDYAKALNLNTLIIDASSCGYSHYKSSLDGFEMNPNLNGFDVVESFCRNCSKQGIRLIPMVCVFNGGAENHENPKGSYLDNFSDKLLITKKNNTFGPFSSKTLNPYDREVRDYQLSIINELVEKYNIDGIQIDYLRFPLPIYYAEPGYEDFGYNKDIVEAFEKKYGYSPLDITISDSRWETWCSFRRDIISSFAKEVYKFVKSVSPQTKVSFTCFVDYNDRQKFVYQDVEKWAEKGYADTIYPMVYRSNTESQLSYAKPFAESVGNNVNIVFGIAAYANATNKSMCEQNYMSYELSTGGVGIFTQRYISTCGYYDILTNSAFRKSAVSFCLGEESVKAGSNMIIDNIINVYLRFFPKEADSLNTLKNSLKEMSCDPKKAVVALTEIKTNLNFEDAKLLGKIVADIDYVIACAKSNIK